MLKLYLYMMLEGSVCTILYYLINYFSPYELGLKRRATFLKMNVMLYLVPFPWLVYQGRVLLQGMAYKLLAYMPKTSERFVIYHKGFWERKYIIINGQMIYLQSHFTLVILEIVVTAIMAMFILAWVATFIISSKRVQKHMHVIETCYVGKKLVPIAESENIASPAIVGFLNPVIVFPKDGSMYASTRDGIIRHEKKHIESRDSMYRLVAGICVAIYWMNPLVYLVYRERRLVSELICDEAALVGQNEEHKKNYMKCIVEAAKYERLVQNFYINFSFLENVVKMRVNRIMGIHQYKNMTNRMATAALVISLFLSILCTTTYEEAYTVDAKTNTVNSYLNADSIVFVKSP